MSEFSERLDTLMEALEKARSEVKQKEEELEWVNRRVAIIENDEIPLLFHEFGFRDATLDDGRKVSLATYYQTSTKDKIKMFDWLIENGYGSIISESFSFRKGADTQPIEKFLESSGYSGQFEKDENAAPVSVKKVVVDHIKEKGEFPPEDAIKVTVFEKATIKDGE